ncbi:fatty acid desaturase family protein [Collimonas pratensis]|uniref:Fatty acid desaturase family protein n=1 Tax=Collimonas pratensis TaxID=279113 RepID=A0A127Q4M4_9BURK|nr:fatty acid desaturase [Collimonas pratensis]AMP04987.1 fatty acid desaturase family protein [Collimonas pratensis]
MPTLNAQTGSTQSRRFDLSNLLVLALQSAVWAGVLTWLSKSDGLSLKWLILIPFCLVMQGVFSMMHETFHGSGHRRARLNYLIMWWASTMFGSSATLIHINHLGHHVRNRARAERADFAGPGESLLRKRIEYYVAILGGIWLGSLVGSIVLALLPAGIAINLSKRGSDNTYAVAFKDFSTQDFHRIRLEVLASIAMWLLAGWILDWKLLTIFIAYIAFAFSWSSLQWVYHMRTPLDPVEGTYNMRAPILVRWAFLNFNYNLTHHRRPRLRWQQLHETSSAIETRPLWFGLLQVFLPPQRLPDDLTQLDKTYF